MLLIERVSINVLTRVYSRASSGRLAVGSLSTRSVAALLRAARVYRSSARIAY